MTEHRGIGIFPSIAFGNIHLLMHALEPSEKEAVLSSAEEWVRFSKAKVQAGEDLTTLFDKTKKELGEEQAMIIDVQRMMLDDGDFNDAIEALIKEDGFSASSAVLQVGGQFAELFASIDDPYMQARATDVTDVSRRVADVLLGIKREITLSESAVIVAEDVTPSETLQLDRSKLVAFVMKQGSESSHTAILAKSIGIPCLVKTEIKLDPNIDGKTIIVDSAEGICYIEPDEKTLKAMTEKKNNADKQREALLTLKGQKSVTKSGKEVQVFANIGGVEDIDSVLQNDAEGIGLFRSEFLYLGRQSYPTEDELFEAYRKVVVAMGDKTVIIRTLDLGADKQVDYFELDQEENPALGLRGIRICIERPDVFRTQLRAIYRASAYGNVGIMFPMIVSEWEIRHCKEQANECIRELKAEGVHVKEVPLGIMIETPASVIISDRLAKEVDFFSVGTNDLTQYTLAIDRTNNKLEQFYDSHHPAVLEMLRTIANSAKKNGIWAGICGELASDTTLTQQFVEMGFSELSVSASSVLEVRKKIREIE